MFFIDEQMNEQMSMER